MATMGNDPSLPMLIVLRPPTERLDEIPHCFTHGWILERDIIAAAEFLGEKKLNA